MKLRIVDQEIRFRLSQADLQALTERGVLEQMIRLGADPDQQLVFGLIRSEEHDTLNVIYEKGHVAVLVPATQASALLTSPTADITHSVAIDDTNSLTVRVEVDRGRSRPDTAS